MFLLLLLVKDNKFSNLFAYDMFGHFLVFYVFQMTVERILKLYNYRKFSWKRSVSSLKLIMDKLCFMARRHYDL